MLKSLVLKTPCAKCSYLVEEILVDLLVAFYQSVDQRVSGHQAFVRYGVVLAAERLEALGAVLEHLQDENTIISHIIQGNSSRRMLRTRQKVLEISERAKEMEEEGILVARIIDCHIFSS